MSVSVHSINDLLSAWEDYVLATGWVSNALKTLTPEEKALLSDISNSALEYRGEKGAFYTEEVRQLHLEAKASKLTAKLSQKAFVLKKNQSSFSKFVSTIFNKKKVGGTSFSSVPDELADVARKVLKELVKDPAIIKKYVFDKEIVRLDEDVQSEYPQTGDPKKYIDGIRRKFAELGVDYRKFFRSSFENNPHYKKALELSKSLKTKQGEDLNVLMKNIALETKLALQDYKVEFMKHTLNY